MPSPLQIRLVLRLNFRHSLFCLLYFLISSFLGFRNPHFFNFSFNFTFFYRFLLFFYIVSFTNGYSIEH